MPEDQKPSHLCRVELIMKHDGSMNMGVESAIPTLYLAKEMCEQAARRIEKLIEEQEAKLIKPIPAAALPALRRTPG